jgi:hypothetical protein
LIFTLTVNRYVFYRQNQGQKQSIEKTLVGNLWFVGEFVSNKFIDGLTNGQSAQKEIYPLHSIGKYNLSLT